MTTTTTRRKRGGRTHGLDAAGPAGALLVRLSTVDRARLEALAAIIARDDGGVRPPLAEVVRAAITAMADANGVEI